VPRFILLVPSSLLLREGLDRGVDVSRYYPKKYLKSYCGA
jgi:hypothetical protein